MTFHHRRELISDIRFSQGRETGDRGLGTGDRAPDGNKTPACCRRRQVPGRGLARFLCGHLQRADQQESRHLQGSRRRRHPPGLGLQRSASDPAGGSVPSDTGFSFALLAGKLVQVNAGNRERLFFEAPRGRKQSIDAAEVGAFASENRRRRRPDLSEPAVAVGQAGVGQLDLRPGSRLRGNLARVRLGQRSVAQQRRKTAGQRRRLWLPQALQLPVQGEAGRPPPPAPPCLGPAL